MEILSELGAPPRMLEFRSRLFILHKLLLTYSYLLLNSLPCHCHFIWTLSTFRIFTLITSRFSHLASANKIITVLSCHLPIMYRNKTGYTTSRLCIATMMTRATSIAFGKSRGIFADNWRRI